MLAFVRLSRAKFLVGGLAAGGLGTAAAAYERGSVDWPIYLLAQATFTAFHAMTHFANDYYDRAADVRAIRTPYSGGSGVLVAGDLAPAVALRAALVTAALGTLGTFALLLGAHRGTAALVAAAAGALAWAYSAPPFRLLARGLGEANTALVVAVLVPLGTYLAQGRNLTAAFAASTLPGAAAMFAMMLAVEYPDLAADRAGGKKNLIVRFGARTSRRLGIACVALAFVASAVAVVCGAPPALAMVQAVALPLGIALCLAFAHYAGPDLGRDEALAGRGVAFFFVVTVCALLAYAAAPGPRATVATNDASAAVSLS